MYHRFMTYAFFHGVRMDRWLGFLFLLERGYSLVSIGLAKAVFDLTILATEVPSGYLADRFGKRSFLIAGRLAGAASALLFLVAKSYWVVLVAMAIRGLSFTLASGTDRAFLQDAVLHQHDRDRFQLILSKYVSIGALGMFVVGAAGGLFAQYSWTALYVAETLFSLVGAVAAWRLPRIPSFVDENVPAAEAESGLMADLRRLLPYGGLLLLILAAATYWAAATTKFLFAQPLLGALGLGPAGVALALSVTDLLSMVGARAAAWLSKSGKVFALPSLAAAEAGLTALLMLPSRLATVAALGASQVLGGLAGVIVEARILEEAPGQLRSTMLSLLSSSISLLVMALFPVFGYVSDRYGLKLMSLSLVGAFLAVSALFVALRWVKVRCSDAHS